MSGQKNAGQKQPKMDLASQYRPLGLKAVLAATMMVKRPLLQKKPA